MALFAKHTQALTLRRLGKSYNEIKQQLNVSKSTLSLWLRNYPLSEERLYQLRTAQRKIEKYRATMLLKREKRLASYYKKQKQLLLPLSERECLLAGIFLYWGEGNKVSSHVVSVSNTDPNVLKFTLLWMTKSLRIPKKDIKVRLHLYKDMDINKETSFWVKKLNISRSNFGNPYIKTTKTTEVIHRGFGHGTCTLNTCHTILKEKILMTIKAIGHYANPNEVEK
ncbi:hypothetical protein COU89_00025 [Candidatus Roizmanbacteria bacterium CG10_big_fil_rev_8_21_14_0_10_45_7]|uniref:Uncharacterized protein n=1 Tax=Candidatus Roizmanbacteria bacterium CG10_big_fil_rev_8_21_14_0_10_45_7 TaxID=1974854 RepID=A0A2M8KVY1_9BACT|nr:MAG: hypothetical protein COU89_00025 [Candidatus Roizmanbacteria bacterium CG10_big_fil_rev_8_21_14_0_10_45_7]